MAPTLYIFPDSPPSRAVMMTAKSIGLNLEIKEFDFSKEEHKTPEFRKLNPQQTVPTLVDDDGYILWESHAIMPYLLTKYGKDNSLYPSDVKIRGLVDQRMHFDTGVAFIKLTEILIPFFDQGKKKIDQTDVATACEVYSLVETFLDGRQWIAGDSLTIADFSYFTTITFIELIVKIDPVKYPKLIAYLKKVESLPVYDVFKEGRGHFAKFVKGLFS